MEGTNEVMGVKKFYICRMRDWRSLESGEGRVEWEERRSEDEEREERNRRRARWGEEVVNKNIKITKNNLK